MGITITKIKLFNYKRFKEYVVEPNEKVNIFVGDNEVGKSSILEAIDLVACGSTKRIDTIGLDRLLNIESVKDFLAGDKSFEKLPILKIELYLSGVSDCAMNGQNNSDDVVADGIRLICEPNFDYQNEIEEALNSSEDYFPYDYYAIRFSTFADEAYTGYKKKLKTVLIDSTNMSSEYAMNDFVKRSYRLLTDENIAERTAHKSDYRKLKNEFQQKSLKGLNDRIGENVNYLFGLKNTPSACLENELMIYENGVGIDCKGTGRQMFIKTDFALKRANDNVDVILMEEPENHLSHSNLRKLVEIVSNSTMGQLFVTTHNSLISTRLELNNLIIMSKDNNDNPIMLKNLSKDTSKYFLKAPVGNMIEFALSSKIVLVEGPSEFMLMDKFYYTVNNDTLNKSNVHVMNIQGLSFKRYLEVAKLLGNKVAVITDNDTNWEKYCRDKYSDFDEQDNIKIFYERDNSKRTFECVLYSINQKLCDRLFGKLANQYMLNNKTEAAFILLENKEKINVPEYIKEAIKWISD